MLIIADIFLVAGALGAALYCHVLSRRLSRFNDLEKGVGGAVAVLSAQVDDLEKALNQSQSMAQAAVDKLSNATKMAEASARQLELLMSSMHDLPNIETSSPPENPFFVRHTANLEPTQ